MTHICTFFYVFYRRNDGCTIVIYFYLTPLHADIFSCNSKISRLKLADRVQGYINSTKPIIILLILKPILSIFFYLFEKCHINNISLYKFMYYVCTKYIVPSYYGQLSKIQNLIKRTLF